MSSKDSSNCSQSEFGNRFRIHAAIYLLIDYFLRIDAIRIEGVEDIVFFLNEDNSNSQVLIQAKSVVNPMIDFKNVLKNLRKALSTLAMNYSKDKDNIEELIMVTNSHNPFKIEENNFFNKDEPVKKQYALLNQDMQQRILDYVKKDGLTIDLNKFSIQMIPYESNDETKKMAHIIGHVKEFITSLDIEDFNWSVDNISKEIIRHWSDMFYENATKSNMTITIKKERISWEIIVFIVEENELFFSDFSLLYEGFQFSYKIHLILKHIFRGESTNYGYVTKILYDFNNYYTQKTNKKLKLINPDKAIIKLYIEEKWDQFEEPIELNTESETEKKRAIQFIIFSIICQKSKIMKIKEKLQLCE